MNIINHGGILKKIKGYLDSENVKVEDLSQQEQEQEFAKLKLEFGNSLDSPSYISNFKKLLVDGKEFYRYNIKSADNLKETEYVTICQNERPLLLLSYSSKGNTDVRYAEEGFITYNDSNRIDSKLKTSLMLIGTSAELNASILDNKKDSYYKKNYKFYYDIGKIVAYQIETDKFFEDDSRLELAKKNVQDISKKIEDRIDEILNINQDYVKEYSIKRKCK